MNADTTNDAFTVGDTGDSQEMSQGGDPSTAAFASRVVTLPKLQRQMSLLKVQRYERMMDRFQLRHVPLGRTVSYTSTTAATQRDVPHTGSGSQPASRRPSSEMPSVTAVADLARYLAKRMSGSVHVVASDADALPHAQRASFLHTVDHATAHASTGREGLLVRPFLPTSIVTRLRIGLVIAVFAVQVVYMPYGIVYYPPDYPMTITLDSIVDGVFLLNLLATGNTAVQPTGRSQMIVSRRAIWRHYRKRGLAIDAVACVPIELILQVVNHEPWLRWLVRITQITIQYTSLQRHINRFYRAWKREAIRADKSLIAWLLYSRYGHLMRIGGIIVMITIMAHYLACVWSWLEADVDLHSQASRDPFATHMHSIYDALQLLQGQGHETTTPAQDLFCSIAVLLGSIALAVVFGHVAILVSNFSANQTSYQRKLERVFAIMGKLQLPHPIRERVHQYYEYLHAEYESLDGEIVKFAKDLSHTLELEVVLFKYMDVVMHVPHWHECSPDFQKQLVLNLSIRVYLPDDYIMRRGEVGTECYIINRGICKQHEYATGNYEPPTPTMIPSDDGSAQLANHPRLSSQLSSQASIPSIPQNKASVRPQSRYSVPDTGRADADGIDSSPYSNVTELKRGQSVGAIALLGNYERSSDLRAVTYAEMCVIERATFQRILTRYPRDREIVLTSILHHTMVHLAADQVPCRLMQMVRAVKPQASVFAGISMVAKAMNPRVTDPSIVFGVTEQLSSRLHELAADEMGDNDDLNTREPLLTTHYAAPKARSEPPDSVETRASVNAESELLRLMQEMHERLVRIERHQQTCCHGSHEESPRVLVRSLTKRANLSEATAPSGAKVAKLTRRHTVKIRKPRSMYTLERPSDANRAMATAHQTFSGDGESTTSDTADPTASSLPSAPKSVLRELVGTLWSRSTGFVQEPHPVPSHSPWADQLFHVKRRPQLRPLDAADSDKRRLTLHRTRSTESQA